jgi:hypothetical protein
MGTEYRADGKAGEEERIALAYAGRLPDGERRQGRTLDRNDGEVVRGWIEYYDRDMVKINRNSGPNLFIRKIHIRYIHEDVEAV